MRPKFYKYLMSALTKQNSLNVTRSSLNESSIDQELINTDTSSNLFITAKNYKQPGGLSRRFFDLKDVF